MSSSKGRVFKVRISNEEILEVEEAAAMLSGTFKQLAEDITEDVIPLPVEDPGILEMVPKVMEWCQKHAKGKATEEDLKEWDANFVNVDEATLYWLFLAADYLDVKELVGQVAQRTADMIKGKKPHQIREIFNIKDDMDPEVVKKVQQENPFVEF